MPQYYSPTAGSQATTTIPQGSWFGRHKVLTGLLAAVVVFVLIGIFGSLNRNPAASPVSGSPVSATGTSSQAAASAPSTPSATPSSEAPSPTSAKQATAFDAKFGQTVAVQDETLFGSDKGNAEYTVSAPVDVPADKFNTPKFGKFVAMVVSVKNNSDKTFPVNPFYFSIETADGQKNNTTEFFMDPPKGLPADLASSEVRPGGVAKGTIIFDVPKSNDWHLVVSNSALRDAAAWGF
jgi:hypothetical protein